ncbi:efflux RND transporter permease subunit [Luteibacter sp. Lutesp34]|uniref:efflux RND transporter permease subunit n=1 Tax=Luteibacter sp. Lutesp34 TaxID=3243030 RepID=UPI0039B6116B
MVRHAATIVLVAAMLAVMGAVAALSLPVGLFPQVSFPRIVVDLTAGDRPADTTSLLVTRPIEDAIRSVPGVNSVRSETSRGEAQISVDFGWGRDMIASTLLVDAAIAKALPDLPAGTSYEVRRMDPTVFPIISYALRGDSLSPVALRDFARFKIAPILASVPGLAKVDVQGGKTAEIEVEVDPHALSSRGLTAADVTGAIAAANEVTAVGRIQDHHKLFLVVTDDPVRDAKAVSAIPLTTADGGRTRVGEVAKVTSGVAPEWTRIAQDGRPAVLLNVYEQPDGNAVQIAAAVRQKLNNLPLPPGISLRNWYDQSELVTASASSVRDAIAIGMVLAAAVLYAFLRSVRLVTIVFGVAPAILAGTTLCLYAFGLSFNIMTLGGMAAAVGLVIDDVMVMIEHMARRMAEAEVKDSETVIYGAAREFFVPLTGSSLATFIVFVPLAFLDGVTGAFSRALSITMGAALVVSWLMTAFVVPVLAAHFSPSASWRHVPARWEKAFDRLHGRLVGVAFRRPWLLVASVGLACAVGVVSYLHVPTGFMPEADEGGFVLDYYTAPGTSIVETERQVAQIESLLRAEPDVDTFSRRLGTGLGGDLGQSYHGDFFVKLKHDHEQHTVDVMNDVRDRILRDVPKVQVEVAQLMEDLIGDLTAVPQPIEVKLYGDDVAVLLPLADRVAASLEKVPGLVDVKSGAQVAGDALDVRIDPDAAAAEGVTPQWVSKAIADSLAGVIATQLPGATRAIGVRVSGPASRNWRIEDLLSAPVRATDGHLFPLSRVASIRPVAGQPQITREDLQDMVPVTARIDQGGIGAAVARVRAELARPGVLPPGVRYELGGLYQQQQVAFAGLQRVFAAALGAEFILLIVLYRRVRIALLVIGASLVSASAVFAGLWMAGVDLNVTAMMGLTMVLGIGTEMSIFLVSEYMAIGHRTGWRSAMRRAVRNRLRPITMTTLAAILTLLPLVLALGQGADMQQPLAVAIVAGLLLQFPMVLVVLPVTIQYAMRSARALS